MRVFLIGFMGSGKSTIGKMIAKELDLDFWDMDEMIQDAVAMSIPEIFNEHGQEYFRQLEHKFIKDLDHTLRGDVILSTGGGAPCFYDNIELLNKAGTTIFLEMTAQQIYDRLKSDVGDRPLLMDKTPAETLNFIGDMLEERKIFYLQANYTVDASRKPEEVRDHILYLLNE